MQFIHTVVANFKLRTRVAPPYSHQSQGNVECFPLSSSSGSALYVKKWEISSCQGIVALWFGCICLGKHPPHLDTKTLDLHLTSEVVGSAVLLRPPSFRTSIALPYFWPTRVMHQLPGLTSANTSRGDLLKSHAALTTSSRPSCVFFASMTCTSNPGSGCQHRP